MNKTDLETLVNELLKEKPNTVLVKSLTHRLGIPYLSHHEEQLTKVIEYMDKVSVSAPRAKKEKESNL